MESLPEVLFQRLFVEPFPKVKSQLASVSAFAKGAVAKAIARREKRMKVAAQRRMREHNMTKSRFVKGWKDSSHYPKSRLHFQPLDISPTFR